MDNIVEINRKKYNAGPWQIWNGGENPVPGKFVQKQLSDETRNTAEEDFVLQSDVYRWNHVYKSGWNNIVCYRVMEKIKPEVVEVIRWVNPVDYEPDGIFVSVYRQGKEQAKITFNLVDGTPDPKSIKMLLC